jgi:ribosomal protein S18 acetylase RimI-like enzyme
VRIEYKTNTASEFLLIEHLTHCNEQFMPPLNTKVSIEAYGKKISKNAIVFEAWEGNILVGMVAMYVNENIEGYLTNVSVFSEYGGKGIASQIFNNLMAYSEENNISSIKLDVNASNVFAISLYKKFGFICIDEKNNQIIMLKKMN